MSRWIVDSDHSCAAFAIKHLALANVRGQFNSLKGAILFDPADKTKTAVDVEIDVAAMTTGNKARDGHLMTADFFDQAKYPSIRFSTTRVDFLEGGSCRVIGSLTLHGVTKQVALDGEYTGPRGNPLGDEISIGFSGSATIDREDFGMMWGSELMEGGGMIAGKDVRLFLDVEADLAE
jgi:polyisoprenoid-binding protein YceI